MKKLLKKWLAMTLAVLMVVGTLPTTAWAARIHEEEGVETPVLDPGDGVVDTLGKHDEEEGETPVDPVDPIDPDNPVDPFWDNKPDGVTATIRADGSWEVKVATTMTTDGESGQWVLGIIPDYPLGDSTTKPSDIWDDKSSIYGESVTTATGLSDKLAPTGQTRGETFIAVEGTGLMSDGFSFSMSSETYGKLNMSKIAAAFGGGQLQFRVFFYAATSSAAATKWVSTIEKSKATGLEDATYVFDLYDNSVQRVTADGLAKDNLATFDGLGTLRIPIHNDSTGTVYASGNTTKYQKVDFASKPDSGCSWIGTLGNLTMDPDQNAPTLPIRYSNPAAGEVIVISVPYYEAEVDSEALPSNAVPIGTANITVLVVYGSWAGEPLTFHVKVAADGTKTVAEGAQKVSAVGGFSDGIMLIPALGGNYEIADESYGIVFTKGEAINSLMTDVIFNDNGEGGMLGPSDDGYTDPNGTMLCGVADDKDGEKRSQGATVSIDPDAISAALEDGKTYTVNITVIYPLDNACEMKNSLTIPVNIIAEVEEEIPPETYSVTYRNAAAPNPQLTTLPSSTSGHAAGSSVTVSATPAANTEQANGSGLYYKFVGWNDGTTTRAPGSSFNITGNTTLTAVWEVVNITVTLNNKSHGTVPTGWPKTIQKGSSTTLPTLTETGWTFAGWSTTDGGAVSVNGGGSTGALTTNTTYYAVWSQNKHKVTYDFGAVTPAGVALPTQADVAEGGKFNVSSTLKTDGTVYTTAAGLGYTFTGWNDGTATRAPGAELTMGTSDITLTAQWSPKNYTVTYVKGNVPAATIGTATYDVQHGGKHTVKTTSDMTNITTGWQFKNWDKTGELTITDNTTTITAQWEVKVSYALDGGTLTDYPADHWVDYNTTDEDFPTSTTPTKSGYTFNGWQDADGNTVTAATKFVKPTIVTAQWQGRSSVAFDVNGGTWTSTGGAQSQTGNTGANITMPAEPTRTGYTFTGWNTSAAGTGSKNQIKFPTTAGQTDTYYAIWTPIKYTVTWNPNGGNWSGSTANATQQLDYDSVIPTYANEPTRTYYTFNGWYTEAACTNKVNFTTTAPKVTGNVTYYAGWKQRTSPVKVILHLNGSEAAIDRDVEIELNGVKQTITQGSTSTTFNGLNQQAAAYTIKAEGATYNKSVTVPNNADETTAVEFVVDFATVEVVTDGHGDAKVTVPAYGTRTAADLTAQTDYDNGTMSKSFIALAGQTATWTNVTSATSPQTDYVFKTWDDSNTNVTEDQTGTTAAGKLTHKAFFQKVAFTVKLTLNLDDQAKKSLDAAGGDVSALTVVRTGGNADTAAHPITWSDADNKWVVSGLKTGTTYKITVTTRTGTYDAVTNLTTDKDDGEINLYSLNVAAGTYGNATNKPYLTTDSTNKPTKAVVLKGTPVPLAANPDSSAWTVTGWVEQGKTTAPSDMNVTTSSATFTDGYSAATAGTGVTITPVYKYATTVVTSYKGTPQNVTSVSVGAGTVANPNPAGNYAITGLTPGTTYTVTVNGYTSSVTFNHEKAGTTVPVAIHKITAEADPAAAATTGFPKVNNAAAVYVPGGATLSAATPTVTAAQGTVAAGYRWLTESGETLWTVKASNGDDIAQIANATGVITTKAGQTVTKDIVVTAHGMKRWTVTAAVSGATGTSAADPTIQTGVGSIGGTNNKVATIDENGVVKITATVDKDQQIKSWAINGGNGKLYSDPGCAVENEIDLATFKGTVAYAKAVTSNATVTVTFESREYELTVQVNKDNQPYAGVKVNLSNDYANAQVTDSNGQATFTVNAGTYTAFANGANTSVTSLTNTGKSTTVNADNNTETDRLITVNYYTIKLVASPAGGGKVAFGSSASSGSATASQIELAGSKKSIGSVAAAAIADTTDTVPKHYRFDKWTAGKGGFGSVTSDSATILTASGSYILPSEEVLSADTSITSSAPITLTATFQEQYKVTVAMKSGLPDNATVGVKLTGDTGAPKDHVMVDAGGTSSATLSATVPSGWFMKEWAAPANSGAFGAPAADDAKLSYTVGDTFTPTADTTITLDLWQDANLAASWVYDIVTDTSDKGHTNITWTPNSAQHAGTNPTTLVITGPDADTTQILDLKTADTSKFTVSGGVYTLKPDYLKTLAVGTYTVTATYDLDTAAGHGNKQAGTKSVTFGIKATAATLTKVVIDPKEDGRTTLKAESDTGKVAEYVSHESDRITATNKLSFTWYYADTAPTEGAVAAGFTPPATWKEISGPTDFPTTGVPEESATTRMKGQYVFALVTASVTGKGTVVSNAIPVDYDAKITVNKDSENVQTQTGYSVWLWPTDETGAFNAADAKAVEARYSDTTKTFDTPASALTGGKSYHVYVTTVEGGTAYQQVTGLTITGTDHEKTVNYYSVNAFDHEDGADLKHAMNGIKPMGESFDTATAPNTVFKVKGGAAANETVPHGNGVVSGTTVTASPSKAWANDHDYKWNWSVQNNASQVKDKPDSLSYGTQGQASGAASADYAITKPNWIGGQMEQRTYDVTGNLVSLQGTGKLATATLTSGEFSFSGEIGNSGTAPAFVTFKGVPRNVATGAVGEHYTISATPGDSTTIIGYSAPAKTATEWNANPVSNAEEVEVLPTATTGCFTIFVEATEKKLTVTDAHDAYEANKGTATHDKDKAEASTIGSASMTHTDTGTFQNYAWKDKTVTITNNGNTDLEVTLNITKGAAPIYSGTQTLDANNKLVDGGVTIGGLDQLTGGKVTLAPKESKNFTIATNTNLNAYDDATYSFTFTSEDTRDTVAEADRQGPTVTYNYKMVINSVHIKHVEANKQDDGSYLVDNSAFTIEEANGKDDLTVGSKTTNNATDPTSGDLIYTWYYADWNADVELDKTDGVPKFRGTNNVLPLGTGTIDQNGQKYTPADDEHGKALYLVVKGRPGSNATSAAMTPNTDEGDPVVLVPYQGVVKLREEDVVLPDAATAGNYEVVLRRKNSTDPDIPMTWDNDDKVFKTNGEVLWARDPDWTAESGDPATAWEYEVWASRVKGNKDADKLQNTGVVITVANKDQDHIVDYYKVQINDTIVTQGIYEGKLTPASTDGIFLTQASLTQTKPDAETTVGGLEVTNGGFVQKGNNVTFQYNDWEKDYKLTWGGAASGNADPGANRTTSVTYSSKVANAVTTELSLKTYDVAAWVVGTVGSANYIKLTLADDGNEYVFHTNPGTGEYLGITGTAVTSIAVNTNQTFQLPKANYTPESESSSSNVELLGYKKPHSSGDAPALNGVTVTAGTDASFDVVLQGSGYAMTVADNVPTGTDKATNSPTKASSSASIANNAPQDGSVTQEITLNYNYNKAQPIIVTASNTSKADEGEEALHLKNVTLNCGTNTWGLTFSDNELATADEDMGQEDSDPKSVTLTIPAGLKAGQTYTHDLVFTFDDTIATDHQTATFTYTLKVTVEKLPFKTVTTAKDTAGHKIGEYTVDVQNDAGKDLTNDGETGLSHGETNDYLYQWVRADLGSTVNVAWDGTANDVDGLITVTGGEKIATATNSTYTPVTADEGKALYLVIFATKDGNASGYAISDPITTGYTGLIRVHKNGTQETTTPNPAYTVKFVPSDNTKPTRTGVWTGTGDKAGYTATMDPAVDYYTVQVSRAQGWGEAADLVTLSDVTITNADRDDDAYYYTVTAKSFEQKDYVDGKTGETITAAEKQFDMTLDGKALTSGTPVLDGQSVSAKAKGWAQDYKLFWQSDKDTGNVSITTDTVDANKQQSSDVASADGAFTKTITEQTFIGGRLDQNTYTVTGYIKNTDGKTGGITKEVELAFKPENGDTRSFTFTANSGAGDHKFVDGSNDGQLGNKGDTVIFTVVKGAYGITATEGGGTVISAVTVGVDDVVKPDEVNTSTGWTDRHKETLPKVTANGRVFNIYLEERGLALKVADGHDGHEATSTTTNNNLQAKHPAVYYFNGVDTTAIPLTLTNPGNAQLTVSGAATKVSSLTGVDFANGTGLGNTIQNGDKVTVKDLPTDENIAANGGTLAGGSVSVAADAANTDDGIYIIRFTSTTTDTAGNAVTGCPVVYYVFDLTVDPLPITAVKAEGLSDGKLQLKDYTAGTADSGLGNITVQYDDAGATDTAANKSLHDSDFSYVWAKAKPGVDVDASKFELTASGMDVKSGVSGVTVLTSGTGYNTQQFTPDDDDQGMNFYLIAYTRGNNSNASEFAVSEAVYAQVTVSIKAYQTKTTTPVPVTDDFNVVGTMGEGDDAVTAKAQNGSFTVTKDGTEIDFEARQADNDDAAKAAWYFVGWGDTTGNFTSTTDLTTTYTVTEKDTVIGYYDLLPELKSDNSFGIGADASPTEANRTFTYKPNNGSQQVAIVMEPLNGTKFKDDGSTGPRVLNYLAFEKVNGAAASATTVFGVGGAYVLKESWVRATLQPNGGRNGEYRITFFDLNKGATTDGSTPSGKYEGYDRSVIYRIVDGEKRVYAQVEDTDGETEGIQGGQGTVQVIGAANGAIGVESNAVSKNGEVTIIATPADGYVFNGWELKTTNGGSFAGDDTAQANTKFYPELDNALVEASFKAGTLSMKDQTAKVIYGNQTWEGDAPAMTATSSATGETFTYAFAAADDLAAAGITDADATDAPGWLKLNADGTFGFNSAVDTNVESSTDDKYTAVDNELVVYVKATATETGKTKIKKVTIDVEPGTLTVKHADGYNDVVGADDTVISKSTERGEAYKTANTAARNPIAVDANGVPMYNETVLKYLFAYTEVHDQADTVIDNTGVAGDKDSSDSGAYTNGTWTVAPGRFSGTGEPSIYTFTFTYKPGDADEKWNYTAAKTDMTLTIAKPPVGAEFADAIANADKVIPGNWTNDENSDYSLVAKPEGYDGTSTPEEMAYTNETFRKNETITYLDKEPSYTVKLHSLDAAIHGTVLTTDALVGFRLAEGSALPTFTNGQFSADDGEKTFVLELAPVNGNVWVGEHHAKFTLSGYSNADLAEEGGEPDVTATYELIVEVKPRVITEVDVTVTDPKETVDDVTPTIDGNPTLDDEDKDEKGNKPIKDVTVVWGPEDGPDGKHTEVKVDVEIDPNYIYTKDDPDTEDVTEPEITDNTDVTVTGHGTPKPDVTRDPETGDPDHIIHISQKIPYLMHDDVRESDGNTTGPKVLDTRTESIMQGDKLGKYTISLGAYGDNAYGVEWVVEGNTLTEGEKALAGATLETLPTNFELDVGDKKSVVLDLTNADTSKTGSYSFTLKAMGKANPDDAEATIPLSTYTFNLTIRSPGGGGGVVEPPCPCKVLYHIGIHGTTEDATIEDVSESSRPSKVPTITALDGYTFRGWSLTNPATLKKGEKIDLVDPKTVDAKGETMIFYAVIVERPFHEHYVVGYPNGNFGPADNITRASVATIIARAILPDFVEGANYGNPGGYSDVSGHWAESAMAYCSEYDVFKGYPDGTFRPDAPITRQEFATVIARLDGELTAKDIPFDDIDEAGEWALDGIYTSYEKGWVNGYSDGTFKPLNNIRRDEAVKVFNAYLNRGVDADGLADLYEYVRSDVAGGGTGNGTDEYMTWPDVPKGHWAYYEIVEAANDHEFTPDFDAELGYTLPEHWEKCWIDDRWGINTASAGAAENAASVVSSGFRIWLH